MSHLLRCAKSSNDWPVTHRGQRLPIGYGLIFAAVISLGLWWGIIKTVGAVWSFFGWAP